MTPAVRTAELLEQPGTTDGGEADERAATGRSPARPRRWRPAGTLVAGLVYLVASVAVWWGVWSTHPTSTTTCGCGDSSLFTWFLAWPAHALAHGLNPLYSTDLFHPTGVNLLANTGVAGLGIVLAPITWAFGVVATLNVALTLSPALSALALFVLVRRWVAWWPAAFFAGLLYGFSPFILVSVTDAHLMLGFAPVPPLIVLCLDELLVRQRWRPVVVGSAIAALATVQFFVGTELLAMVALAAGFGIALVVAYGFLHRALSPARIGYAARGLAWAIGATVALLAWPTWFALAGPAHFSGPIWPAPISYGGATPRGYVWPIPPSADATALAHQFGGYQAPTPSAQYFGIGLVLVIAAGLIAWWRDLRLWLFAAVGLAATLMARGLDPHGWTAWRLLLHLPQMENLIPSRFALIAYLCAAVMLAIVVDRTHDAVMGRARRSAQGAPGTGRRRFRTAASLAGLGVVAIALGPIAGQLLPILPLRAVPVVLPQWFATQATRLPSGQVLLIFPPPFAFRQSAMTWQAVNGMRYAQVGGGGPGSVPTRAGPERAGQAVLSDLAFSAGVPTLVPSEIAPVRRALAGWGVTEVVLPDPDPLPEYARVDTARQIVMLMTAAVGRPPVHRQGAWVWPDIGHAPPPARPPATVLRSCGGPPSGSVSSLAASARCVLAPSTG